MAGYLRQLAEQAMRPAPGLRSAATAAYPPEPVLPVDEPVAAPMPGFVSTDPPEFAGTRPESSRRARRDEGATLAKPGPGIPTTGETVRAAIHPRPSRAAPESAAFTTRAAGRCQTSPTPERQTMGGRHPAPLAPRTNARDPLHDRSSARTAPVAGTRLSPASRPPHETLSGQAAARARTDTSHRAPAPDIHIHIGRIELSAGNPPAPTRRTAAKGAGPMTLDAYLRQRGRKSP